MSISTLSHVSGDSPLERLPAELLRRILIYVTLPDQSSNYIKCKNLYPIIIPYHILSQHRLTSYRHLDPKDVNRRPKQPPLNSLPCLLTSRTLHTATFPVMYRNVTTAGPSTLTKFLTQLRCHPNLGTLVRSLDLGPTSRTIHFSDEKIANPIPELLRLTPLLREIKIQPALYQYIDKQTLVCVFSQLSYLETIDLENCNTPTFGSDFAALCSLPGFHISSTITNLNLEGCHDLPPIVFETLLPQLPRLKTLIASRTQITDQALLSIPSTAQLITLSINNCPFLSGFGISSFVAQHPAARTLDTLYAATDPAINPMLEEDVTRILSKAPSTLQCLDLRNSLMTPRNVPLLRRLVTQLKDLRVGSQLSMQDIESLYLAPEVATEQAVSIPLEVPPASNFKDNVVLEPMARAVAICNLRTRLRSTPSLPIDQQPRLRSLDISSLPIAEQGKLRTSVLLGPHARYLHAISVSGDVVGKFEILKRVVKAVGWCLLDATSCCMVMRDEELI